MSALGYTSTVRRARKVHVCFSCSRHILPGTQYHDAIAAPWYDFNPNPGHWTRGHFCTHCYPLDP